jgi:hypothetical protein
MRRRCPGLLDDYRETITAHRHARYSLTNMFVMLGCMEIEFRTLMNPSERPAKPALTSAGIVASAIEIMRAEGLERTTMRRLAQALDAGTAWILVRSRSPATAGIDPPASSTPTPRSASTSPRWPDLRW